MSVTKNVTVHCDGPSCNCYVSAQTAVEARKIARSADMWPVTSKYSRDFCSAKCEDAFTEYMEALKRKAEDEAFIESGTLDVNTAGNS